MSKQLRNLLIVIGAVLALWLIIILPDRISYFKSENYQYDKKCSELEKQLKKEFGKHLGEIKVSFKTEENLLTAAFYEKSYYFDRSYECKKAVEEYINSHPDFFVHELKSKVEVQSKTDPFMDYPREMYIYTGVADGVLKLDELKYQTDAYAIERAQKTELDIKTLTVTNYGDFNSAVIVAEHAPSLEKITFTEKYRQPDGEQLEELKKIVGGGCIIELYEENDIKEN